MYELRSQLQWSDVMCQQLFWTGRTVTDRELLAIRLLLQLLKRRVGIKQQSSSGHKFRRLGAPAHRLHLVTLLRI